jgi:hypothetical protein
MMRRGSVSTGLKGFRWEIALTIEIGKLMAEWLGSLSGKQLEGVLRVLMRVLQPSACVSLARASEIDHLNDDGPPWSPPFMSACCP